VTEQQPGQSRVHSLPRYCYYCLPLSLLLPAVVALGAGRDFPYRLPIWCYLLYAVSGLVVGLPILWSFARVIRDIGEASLGRFRPVSNVHKLLVGTVLIFKLPASMRDKHGWSARVYYGSLIACALVSAVVGTASFVTSTLLRRGHF